MSLYRKLPSESIVKRVNSRPSRRGIGTGSPFTRKLTADTAPTLTWMGGTPTSVRARCGVPLPYSSREPGASYHSVHDSPLYSNRTRIGAAAVSDSPAALDSEPVEVSSGGAATDAVVASGTLGADGVSSGTDSASKLGCSTGGGV